MGIIAVNVRVNDERKNYLPGAVTRSSLCVVKKEFDLLSTKRKTVHITKIFPGQGADKYAINSSHPI